MPDISADVWKKTRHSDAEGSGVAAAIKAYDSARPKKLAGSTAQQIQAAITAAKGLETALGKAATKIKASKSKDKAKLDATTKLIAEWSKEAKDAQALFKKFDEGRDAAAAKDKAAHDKWEQTSITKAIAIYDGWSVKAEFYAQKFAAEKKGPIATAKADLRKLQQVVDAGFPPLQTKAVLVAIGNVTKALTDSRTKMEGEYKKFDAWAMGDPRSSTTAIKKQLGLELEPTIMSKVSDATKTKLLENAQAISVAKGAWNNDVKVALQQLLDTAATLDKLARQKGDKGAAYDSLLEKEYETLKKSIDKVVADLKAKKVSKATAVRTNIKELGRPVRGEDLMAKQMEQEMRIALQAIATLTASLPKQHGRIQKSVPDDVWKASKTRPKLDQLIAESTKEAGTMQDECTYALDELAKFNKKVAA